MTKRRCLKKVHDHADLHYRYHSYLKVIEISKNKYVNMYKRACSSYSNKMNIGDEEIYYNRLGTVILFQCRTNTLRLKWRQGFNVGAMDCPLCRAVEETVAHFIN